MENKTNRLLPADYHGKKYGLTFRLVTEDDADFIVEARTNPAVGQFLHYTSNSIVEQKKWIKEYKKRESDGSDYYFIFFKDNYPVGLNRIYNINNSVFTGGSWAMLPQLSMEIILAVPLITREIAFETLGFDFENDHDGVHVDNKHVMRFNKLFGCKEGPIYKTNEGDFIPLTLTKEDFEANKPRLVSMLNLDSNE